MAVMLPAVDALLDLGSVTLPLQPAALFGAPVALEIELGAGNGRFLVDYAAGRPATGLVGVERSAKYLRLAVARAARLGAANVKLARTTAEDLLFRCLGEESVDAVHVYFPDPWPKKRHHKRRLFGAANVRRIAEVLRRGGVLRVKTDHAGYGAAIEDALREEPRLERIPAEPAFAGVPPTQYELKYAREGREVLRLALRRA